MSIARCGEVHRLPGALAALIEIEENPSLSVRTDAESGQTLLGRCEMALLEPVADVTVRAPADSLGGVLGDLAARRGQVAAA